MPANLGPYETSLRRARLCALVPLSIGWITYFLWVLTGESFIFSVGQSGLLALQMGDLLLPLEECGGVMLLITNELC